MGSISDYQELVVEERPGLPRDELRPLRTPLARPLADNNRDTRWDQIS